MFQLIPYTENVCMRGHITLIYLNFIQLIVSLTYSYFV